MVTELFQGVVMAVLLIALLCAAAYGVILAGRAADWLELHFGYGRLTPRPRHDTLGKEVRHDRC